MVDTAGEFFRHKNNGARSPSHSASAVCLYFLLHPNPENPVVRHYQREEAPGGSQPGCIMSSGACCCFSSVSVYVSLHTAPCITGFFIRRSFWITGFSGFGCSKNYKQAALANDWGYGRRFFLCLENLPAVSTKSIPRSFQIGVILTEIQPPVGR